MTNFVNSIKSIDGEYDVTEEITSLVLLEDTTKSKNLIKW